MSPEYAAFLASAFATHGLVGAALGAALFDRPGLGVVAGLPPDVDLLFPAALGWPFVHRGITHSLVAVALLATVTAAAWYTTVDPDDAPAAGAAAVVASLSHLLIDVTTPKGIPPLSPLSDQVISLSLPTTGHSPVPTVILWVGCLVVLSRADSVAWSDPGFPSLGGRD
ncbi:MAG: metal-dependent hydrolase [Halolamina sp.]